MPPASLVVIFGAGVPRLPEVAYVQQPTAPGPAPRLIPGAVLYLADDSDYRYGVGPLALRVGAVEFAPDRIPRGLEWLRVEGRRVGSDGGVDARPLSVLVRVGALCRDGTIRPAGWTPPTTRPVVPIRRLPPAT